MRFYIKQHKFYAGIDLHSRLIHVCVLDPAATSSWAADRQRTAIENTVQTVH